VTGQVTHRHLMANAPESSDGDGHGIDHRLLEAVRCAVVELDDRGLITALNAEAERVFGWQRGEVAGRRFVELCTPVAIRRRLSDQLAAALAGSPAGWIEGTFTAPDGHERLLVWTVNHPAEGRTLFVGQDITARRRAEQEARRLATESESRRRLAELGAVAASIVHDIGNPLTIASLVSARLLRAAQVQGERTLASVRGDLVELDAMVHYLLNIVVRSRRFLREQRLDLRPVDVAGLVQEIVASWSSTAIERGVTLSADVAPGLGEIRADREKLRGALECLVKNALEAVDEVSGHVRVHASTRGTDGVQLAVEDDGPGIPAGVNVFGLFETTKTEGCGLGLATARMLVEAHGGTLSHEPRRPRGSVFRIDLAREPRR
jgi:two-component system sensor kinase FixL